MLYLWFEMTRWWVNEENIFFWLNNHFNIRNKLEQEEILPYLSGDTCLSNSRSESSWLGDWSNSKRGLPSFTPVHWSEIKSQHVSDSDTQKSPRNKDVPFQQFNQIWFILIFLHTVWPQTANQHRSQHIYIIKEVAYVIWSAGGAVRLKWAKLVQIL